MVDGSTIQCPKQGATDTGQGCLVWPDMLGQGPGHSSTHFTDCPQMCALCRQAPLSLTPAQRDEGLQLDKATDETELLYVIHAAALGLSVCPSGGQGFCREPGPVCAPGGCFVVATLRLALALPAVLQHRVALKGEWEPGQATAATVSVTYEGC